ncbi:MAG: Crp/Fnr family transcriptional regulator [Nitrospirae bacterium]|nr:Crp/Fnr family transcriptional regulator [Nitrospirota bacterium]
MLKKASLSRSDSPDFERLLRTVPFFSGLSDSEFKDLRHILVEKSFPKNRVILVEEDTQNYMYIILSGKVKVVHLGSDGKEHILAIHRGGDFFGEMSLLDGKTAPATVVAMEDTSVVIISRKDFEEYFLRNEKVLRQIIFILCSRLRESWLMLRVLNLPNAEDRVRSVLKLVSMQYGVRDQRGMIITLNITHQGIADYSALSRETVTRVMNRLVKSGEIEILDSRIILLKHAFIEKMQLL